MLIDSSLDVAEIPPIIETRDTTAPTVASLFAGIGGFCSAFKNEGFRVVWANELDQFAARTYRHNHSDVKLIEKSITSLSVVKDHLEPVDVLTAGFPCQPFSVAGAKKGFNDPRGKLFFEIIRLLKEFGQDRPKILLFENVRNLLSHDKGQVFTRISDEIQSAGYWFMPWNSTVLNTRTHTDIPQNRERLFMVAFSWDAFDFNDFQFPEPVPIQKSRADILMTNEKAEADLYFDEESQYGRLFAESMATGKSDSVYLLRRHYVRENKSDSFFTLTANMGEGGHNVPVVKDPWGIRQLSPRECLRLQGFSDTRFTFPAELSKTQKYKQIGNAVTVPLVQKLAKECLRQLKENLKKGLK
ncbi:DNA cytosine methyltransferase [Herbaspirillum sp. RV1423]|uniref:DNA cytosine methyltransferase n=1 Tax=Herbaspirillum sp. RV1423 TaxID=1443993 RepID=UPI0004BCC82B|nr:DNA (cytosine-5-)-methyltransferase [Herbaspirillum sp. RV1423]